MTLTLIQVLPLAVLALAASPAAAVPADPLASAYEAARKAGADAKRPAPAAGLAMQDEPLKDALDEMQQAMLRGKPAAIGDLRSAGSGVCLCAEQLAKGSWKANLQSVITRVEGGGDPVQDYDKVSRITLLFAGRWGSKEALPAAIPESEGAVAYLYHTWVPRSNEDLGAAPPVRTVFPHGRETVGFELRKREDTLYSYGRLIRKADEKSREEFETVYCAFAEGGPGVREPVHPPAPLPHLW